MSADRYVGAVEASDWSTVRAAMCGLSVLLIWFVAALQSRMSSRYGNGRQYKPHPTAP